MHRWDPICRPPRGLVQPVPVDPSGVAGPTRHEVTAHLWRQTSRGLYVPPGTPTDPVEQRILEQAHRLPVDGAVTGWAALRLHGAAFFDGLGDDGSTELPVPLALGPRGNVRGDPRVRLGYEPLPFAEIVLRQGLRVTTPVRALFDEVRALDLRKGVVAVDMAMAARLVSVRRLRVYADAHRRWRRSARIPPVLDLASEHSRSPRETALRNVWRLDAGLPPPLVNCPVHDIGGRLLGVADLLDLDAGLVVEFDGAEHRGAGRHTRDVAKDHALRQVGLEVTRVTGTDLRDTALVVRRLCEARDRAPFTPTDQRRWQARPPEDGLDAWLDEREATIRRHEEAQLSHVDEDDTP